MKYQIQNPMAKWFQYQQKCIYRNKFQAEEGGTLEYIPTYRPKDETKEEKKARKSLVKEGRWVSQYLNSDVLCNVFQFNTNKNYK